MNFGIVRVGDLRQSLMEAYLSRREELARFLAARLGSRESAQDVLQDLFLRLDRSAQASEIRDPVAYVFRMAANLANDHRRSQRRAQARDAAWASARHVVMGSETVADTPSAEASYGAKQRVEAVRRALDELSPQCRRVFLLHKFEGRSHEEIANQVGISRSTVEKHMHTALTHLIRRLGRG
jgi:RNA polymerase sigma-70 factor (ECF subfamily)